MGHAPVASSPVDGGSADKSVSNPHARLGIVPDCGLSCSTRCLYFCIQFISLTCCCAHGTSRFVHRDVHGEKQLPSALYTMHTEFSINNILGSNTLILDWLHIPHAINREYRVHRVHPIQ